MVVNSQTNRRSDVPYGSATLFTSQRAAAGSTLSSEFVDVSRDRVKSFGFRGNQVGSWFLDVAFTGTTKPFILAQGTFPSGPGSIKLASFEEALRFARGRVIPRTTGSFSIFYGGRIS